MTIKRKMAVCVLLCAGVHISAMDEKHKDQQKHLLEPVETEAQREWREAVDRFRTYDLDDPKNKFDPQKHFLETGETEEQRERRLEKFREAMYEAEEDMRPLMEKLRWERLLAEKKAQKK